MTNLEALETLVNSRILQVRYLDWGIEITTTDGETVVIVATDYEDLAISVKGMEG